jgi:predicted amino acid dehydrogenase
VDDASWAALTLSLTVLGGIWTWYAFRNRGLASGIRGVGLTLVPLAAYLTNTLRMFTRIVDAVGDWAGALVLSPKVWVGIVVAGVAVVAFAVARAIDARRPRRTTAPGRLERPREERGAPAVQDDDMADIEALLRKRGIS